MAIPTSDLDATDLRLCGHYRDADASFCLSTDTFGSLGFDNGIGQDYDPTVTNNGTYAIEYWAFKYQIPVTYCIAPSIDPTTGLRNISFSGIGEMFDSGGVKAGMYYRSDSIDGRFTTAGSMPVPAAKETMILQQGVLNAIIGHNLSTAGYRGQGYPVTKAVESSLMKYVICARIAANLGYSINGSNQVTDLDSYYGKLLNDTILGQIHNQARSGYDKSHADMMANKCTLASQLENASAVSDTDFNNMKDVFEIIIGHIYDTNGGGDIFEHLYNMASGRAVDGREYARQVLETIRESIALKQADKTKTTFLSHSEYYQYYYHRSLVTEVSAVVNSHATPSQRSIDLYLQLEDKFPNFKNVDSIYMPVSVFLDLSGTSFASGGISGLGCTDIISLGSDQYIVNVAFTGVTEGVVKCVLLYDSSPEYTDLSVPTFSSVTDTSDVITVTTSIPTKCACFKMTTANETGLNIHGRSNYYSTTHTFSKSIAGNYRIGIVSEAGITNNYEHTVS